MSTDYGKFNGWENWQPNYISGNTLWLDGKDESNIVKDGSENVSGWKNKKEDFSVYIPDDPLFGTTDAGSVISTTNVENNNTYIFDGSLGINLLMRDKTYAGGAGAITPEFNINDIYKMTFDVWIDSDANHTHIAIRERDVSYRDLSGFGVIRGNGWVTMDLEWKANSAYDYFRFYPSNNGTSAYNGADSGDKFKIRNLTYFYNKGFGMYAIANQPIYTPSSNSITFNGIDQFLNASQWLSEYSEDTQGELIILFKRINVTKQTYIFSYGDSSASNNALLFDHASTGAGTLPNDIRVFTSDSGSTVNAVGSDSNDIDNKIISWSSNESTWKIFKNGNELPLTNVGSNNGFWFNNIIGDKLVIGTWAGSIDTYGNVDVSEIIYYNRQLSNKERKAVFHYLNTKYSIY